MQSTMETEPRNCFPRKTKFSTFSVNEIILFNKAKSRSKSSGKKYFTVLLLLSYLSGNFVENIFCKMRSKLESHNLTYFTVANSGGKMRHIASF